MEDSNLTILILIMDVSPFRDIHIHTIELRGWSVLMYVLAITAARYKSTGSYVPKETFPDELRSFDAILFGAVGDPHVSRNAAFTTFHP